jgi:phenylacetic acid degradation protein
LPDELLGEWEACEPLREIPANRPAQEKLYANWKYGLDK